jgi:cytidylate kinase
MPVITINGPIGAGSIEVGQKVSSEMMLNYVDRMVFAEAARIIGSPVSNLIAKEQRVERFGDRVAALFGRVLERAAVSGDYDLGVGIESLPETYHELAGESSSRVQRVNDQVFIDTTQEVVRNLAQAGHVVIIGRGANVILGDDPGVLHVGILAPLQKRVVTIMDREHLGADEAKTYLEELEEARVRFFQKFFNVSPHDPTLYHIMLDMGHMSSDTAAKIIAHAAGDLDN